MAGNELARTNHAEAFELALVKGDLSNLSTDERLAYYNQTCISLGLNPLTKPFEYINLNGKLQLYARKDATDQLRSTRRVSISIVSREQIGDVHAVTARATLPDGRCDESLGAVVTGNLKGDALANALMKAETKAKRRVTLSICGLGLLDETEIETIPPEKVKPSVRIARVEALPAPAPKESDESLIERFTKAIEETKTKDELLGVAGQLKSLGLEQTHPVRLSLAAIYEKQKKTL